MRLLDRKAAEDFLARAGVSRSEIAKIMTGFDLKQPMYAQLFWPDDVVYQLVRLPSALDLLPATGSWFGLSGMTSRGIAVNDGLSGRALSAFRITMPFEALEGMAARFSGSVHSGIGGPGGQTQVFIPKSLHNRLEALGPKDRW